jgi:hypothetical protein
MILVHLIPTVLRTKPALLEEILFIKDGPLAFFGQTANMHQPMRSLVMFLFERPDLYLAGLEKSGAFVEHGGLTDRPAGPVQAGAGSVNGRERGSYSLNFLAAPAVCRENNSVPAPGVQGAVLTKE